MESQIKTAVITGGSSGFGEAIVRTLAANNFNVCLGARRIDKLKNIAESLQGKVTGKVHFHSLDVASTDSVKAFADFTFRQFPTIDVVVNNAGFAFGRDSIATASEKDWTAMFDTNLMGVFRTTQAFLPSMEKISSGHIVNIGSIAGIEAYEGGGGYCGTKFALRAFTKTLRLETLGKNIRVTSIDPGMAETEFSEVRFHGDKQKAKAVYEGLQALTPQDIADAVLYAVTRPPHVNIDEILIMPTAQASATKVCRTP